MALNFPSSPTDGQIYYDATSGNRYVYDTANTLWKYASNSSITNSSNTQVLYNNDGVMDGSNGLTFSANTLYVDTINIANSISTVNTISFNVNDSVNPLSMGQLQWNLDDDTLDIGLANGSVLQTGQEIHYRVKNQTGVTITQGTVVRAAGTLGSSGRILVAPFNSICLFDSNFCFGVATSDIDNGIDGYITHFGKVRGIDTSMWPDGTILYANASVEGELSSTMPTAPNNKITVAIVIHSDPVNGVLFIRPTWGSRLNEDELAELTTLANGDVLVYNTTTSRFENNPQTSLNVDKVDGFDASTILGSANNSANSANVYAGSMANSANATSNTNDAAGNAWSNTVSGYSNTWANTVSGYSNTWANTVGSISNTWANTQTAVANGWTNSQITVANNWTNSQITVANNYAGTMANAANATANTQHATGNVWANTVAGYSNTWANTQGGISNTWANTQGGISNTWSNSQTTVANNYAGTMANAANAYAGSMANAANATSNTNDVAGNAWANTVASYSNTWANTVGASGNTWANTKLSNTDGITFQGSLTFTANVTATDTMFAQHFDNSSDIKLKKNVTPINDPMIVISQLNPVSFNWISNDKKSFGFIAQEVEKIIPEITNTREDGTKTLSYIDIISFLVAAVKEHQEEINILNRKIDAIYQKNA